VSGPTERPLRTPLDALDAGAVDALIEANDAAFLLALGRAGGGEERDEPHLRWTIGGSPVDYHNAVVHADLSARSPAAVDAAIEEAIGRFRAWGVPGTWHVGPTTRPADLGARLLAHGFRGGEGDLSMAADLETLEALHREQTVAPGLHVERVADAAGLETWARIRGLDPEGAAESRWVAAMYARIGLGDATPWRHFLAWLDGAPVATASLFLAAGVAGVYFVLTVPAARRRGVGAAITLAALDAARARGYRIAVLGSSPMGEPLYRRLGFRGYGRIRVYDWHPDDA
jgi:GNAT superfamily N-acetyltransferase